VNQDISRIDRIEHRSQISASTFSVTALMPCQLPIVSDRHSGKPSLPNLGVSTGRSLRREAIHLPPNHGPQILLELIEARSGLFLGVVLNQAITHGANVRIHSFHAP